MNRYVVEGMVNDLLRSKRILYIGQNMAQATHALESVADSLRDADHFTIYRAHGHEIIQHDGGGWIRFTSTRSRAGRGLAADVVFCDCDPSVELFTEIAPIVNATNGEVMRA